MKFDQPIGARELQRGEKAPFEVKSIDAQMILTSVRDGGKVEIIVGSGVTYTFMAIPGGHPEKVVLVGSNGEMEVLDARTDLKSGYEENLKSSYKELLESSHKKELKFGSEEHLKLADETDKGSGFRVGELFVHKTDDNHSFSIEKIIITPGHRAADKQEVKPTGAERSEDDRFYIPSDEVLSYLDGGGTIEFTTDSGSIYTFQQLTGGNPEKIVMVHKKDNDLKKAGERRTDGDIEIMDAKKDFLFGIKVGEIFRYNKGKKKTENIDHIRVMYTHALDEDLVA